MTYEVKPPEMKVEYGGPDKVQVVANPRLQPAKCILCGAPGDGRPFVDIGCFIEWYGAVYFCAYCIVDMANHLGYYTPSQHDVITMQLTAAMSENHELAGQNDNYRDILRTILNLTGNELGNYLLRYREYTQWREHQTRSIDNDSATAEDDIGTDKQSDESGSDDVPSASSGQQLEFDFDQ